MLRATRAWSLKSNDNPRLPYSFVNMKHEFTPFVMSRFFTTSPGKLPQNYFRQSRPLQNIQNSPTAHRLINRPMNRRIEALNHLRHYLRFRVCLSHNQREHNSERELLVSVFLHGLVIGAVSGTVFSTVCFPVSELSWSSSFQ